MFLNRRVGKIALDKANRLLNIRPLIDTDKNLIIVAKITEKLNKQC
jgi:hypothetical protein